ncbi:MAG TPA: hypothetical protein VGG34_01485 [Opitutaceae bacterium]|jgi:hypothetical protein
MNRFLLLCALAAAALAPAALATNTGSEPFYISSDGNDVALENLVFDSGTSISGTGTFDFSAGTLIMSANTNIPALTISGTAGAGFLDLTSQSAVPAYLSGSIRLYSDASNKLAWIGATGFTRSFDGSITANRVYTLPDVSGTLITSGNLSSITTVGTLTSGVWNGTAIANAYLANSSVSIAGNSVALGASLSLDTLTGVSTNGFLERTGANALTSLGSTGAGSVVLSTSPTLLTSLLVTQTGSGPSSAQLSASVNAPAVSYTSNTTGGFHYAQVNSNGTLVLQIFDSGLAAISASSTGGLAVGGGLNVSGTTAATSTSSGAIVDVGGLGVAGAVYAGSLNTTTIGSISSAVLTITGGTSNSTITLNGTSTSPENSYAAPSSATTSQVGHAFTFASTSSGGGTAVGARIVDTVNQSGSSGFVDLFINRTQTATGSAAEALAQFSVGSTAWYTFNIGNAATTGDFNGSSGTAVAADFEPNFSGETSSAGWTALKVNATDGSGSGTKTLIQGLLGGSSVFSVLSNGNLSATGTVGSGGAVLAATAPTHGAGTWGLGTIRTGSGLAVSTSNGLELSVGGVVYDVALLTSTP